MVNIFDSHELPPFIIIISHDYVFYILSQVIGEPNFHNNSKSILYIRIIIMD